MDRRLLISFSDAFFDLDGEQVLPATSLRIYEGDRWAIVGRNGAGKKLLIRAMEGRLPRRGGRGDLFPEEAGADEARRPGIICVYPDSHRELTRGDTLPQARWESLFRDGYPTVEEYLTTLSGSEAAFAEVIALMRIEPLIDRRLISLSNGEGRKVSLAAALLRNPQILVVCEPFLAVDKEYRSYLRETLGRLMQSGRTVVLSVSDPNDIIPEIERAVVLDSRRVCYAGDRVSAVSVFEKEVLPTEQVSSTASLSSAQASDIHAAPVIEMRSVNLTYGATEVLKGIDWVVRSGERWALLGANGAGKSALISLIAGDNPQAYVNDVSFLGRRRGTGETIWDIKRSIGFVAPELFGIIPLYRSCLDTVLSGFQQVPELVGKADDSQIKSAIEALELVGLADRHQKPLGSLPKGLQRLVLLARAVVHHPALLILDEPCENLDRENRERFDACLGRISREASLPFVLATHRLKELPNCLTHVLVLESGSVSQVWTPQHTEPLHYCELG